MPVSIIPDIVFNVGAGNAPDAVVITTISTTILAENRSRKWCVLTNTGNKDVFMGLGQAAEVGKGILLAGGGGSDVLGTDFMTYDELTGIVAVSTSTVLVQETQ